MDNNIICKINHITKHFPGVIALDNVNFEIMRGEIHAIVGEHGAGKSTLMRILATVTKSGAMAAALGGLGINGKLIIIGAAEDTLEVSPIALIARRLVIAGWYSGASIDSQDTMAFSVLTGVRSMNEVFPLERAPEAYDHMLSGRARFRVVLTTET